jgi:hypothetical protein
MKKARQIGFLLILAGTLYLFKNIRGRWTFAGHFDNTKDILIVGGLILLSGAVLFFIGNKSKQKTNQKNKFEE